MKRLFCASLLLLILTRFATAGGIKPPAIADLSSYPQARVTRVLDGDTVDLAWLAGHTTDTCRLRLIGVDTPEKRPCWKSRWRVEPYSHEASVFTENLLLGETVWVRLKAGSVTHGRLVGWLWRVPDGICVNLELVRQGYARVYEPDKPKYDFEGKRDYLMWETRARQARKGIWSIKQGENRRETNDKSHRDGAAAGRRRVPSRVPSPNDRGGSGRAKRRAD